MRIKTVKQFLAYLLVNNIFSGTNAWTIKRKLLQCAGWTIGKETRIVGPVTCSGAVVIGDHCWIGRDFYVYGNGTVIIGDNCDIAPGVSFFTGGHSIGPSSRRAGEGETYTIRVGDGCWIGGNSSFVRELTVGCGSVVAACACVTKNVPDNSLVGGVPAVKLRSL